MKEIWMVRQMDMAKLSIIMDNINIKDKLKKQKPMVKER